MLGLNLGRPCARQTSYLFVLLLQSFLLSLYNELGIPDFFLYLLVFSPAVSIASIVRLSSPGVSILALELFFLIKVLGDSLLGSHDHGSGLSCSCSEEKEI